MWLEECSPSLVGQLPSGGCPVIDSGHSGGGLVSLGLPEVRQQSQYLEIEENRIPFVELPFLIQKVLSHNMNQLGGVDKAEPLAVLLPLPHERLWCL